MPSFKPKANKKIKVCKRYSTTLDGKHKEIMADFSKDEFDIIPRLKEEKQQLIVKLSESKLHFYRIQYSYITPNLVVQ